MSYPRARLWLGISTVGFVVVLAVIALAADGPGRVLPASGSVSAWSLFVLGAVVLLAPFDLLGGYVLPRRFGRLDVGLGEFAVAWLRGVCVQSAVIIGVGAAMMAAAEAGGLAAGIGTAAAASFLLLAFQAPIARLTAQFRRNLSPGYGSSAVWESSDSGFTGGAPPFGGPAAVVPAAWINRLPPRAAKTLAARRLSLARSGASRRGALAAWLWNLASFCGVALLLRPDLSSAAGLATQALGFTLASFAGLLALPVVSRAAVFSVDREMLRRGVHRGELAESIRALGDFDEQESRRSAELESVFHPVPCASRRVESLDRGRGGSIPYWNVARFALYSSWAFLGLLGRAVHCNCGRPALWVMLPAD